MMRDKTLEAIVARSLKLKAFAKNVIDFFVPLVFVICKHEAGKKISRRKTIYLAARYAIISNYRVTIVLGLPFCVAKRN